MRLSARRTAMGVFAVLAIAGCSPSNNTTPAVVGTPAPVTQGSGSSAAVEPQAEADQKARPADVGQQPWTAAIAADPSLKHLSGRVPASSRTSGDFTLLSFESPSGGEGVLVLIRGQGASAAVVDAGTAWVGCGLIDPAAAADLGLLCG